LARGQGHSVARDAQVSCARAAAGIVGADVTYELQRAAQESPTPAVPDAAAGYVAGGPCCPTMLHTPLRRRPRAPRPPRHRASKTVARPSRSLAPPRRASQRPLRRRLGRHADAEDSDSVQHASSAERPASQAPSRRSTRSQVVEPLADPPAKPAGSRGRKQSKRQRQGPATFSLKLHRIENLPLPDNGGQVNCAGTLRPACGLQNRCGGPGFGWRSLLPTRDRKSVV
jgi:hypothetical protein